MKTNWSTFNYNYAAIEPTLLSAIDFLTNGTVNRIICDDDRINCTFFFSSVIFITLGQIPFISLYSIFLKVWLFLHLQPLIIAIYSCILWPPEVLGYIYDLLFSSLWGHSPFVRNGLPLFVRDESKTQFFLYKRLALRTDVNKWLALTTDVNKWFVLRTGRK